MTCREGRAGHVTNMSRDMSRPLHRAARDAVESQLEKLADHVAGLDADAKAREEALGRAKAERGAREKERDAAMGARDAASLPPGCLHCTYTYTGVWFASSL